MAGTVLVLGVTAALVVAGVAIYNGLVRLRNASENAWSDIDVQLKRRCDLVPNLVATVRGYAQHEKQTFDEVTRARSRALAERAPEARASAEGELTQALAHLFAVAEAYPELKANQNFLSLQSELAAIEEAIQNARRYYNAVVRDLNTRCETVPSVLVARGFGFAKREYFELDSPAERSAPAVSFER